MCLTPTGRGAGVAGVDLRLALADSSFEEQQHLWPGVGGG